MKTILMGPCLLVCAGALLAGCSSVVAVKDVTADQDNYLRRNFAPSETDPTLLAKLPKSGTVAFSRIVLTRQVTTTSPDGKKEVNVATSTYFDGGNGVVYYKTELAANGIPYGLAFATSYKGWLSLRTQLVPLRSQTTTPIYEIKEINDITPVPTDIGKTFTAKFKNGTTMQIVNYFDFERSCTATRRLPASELNGKLEGTVLEFDCEERSGNLVRNRGKWAMLEKYGFAVQTESTSSSSTSTYQITDVSGG